MNNIFDIDRLNEVWETIRRNKRRSLLTAFGVFWGVFMLVVMLSVGKGIQNGIMGQISSIPQNMSLCWSDKTNIPYMGFRKGRWWSLKGDDVAALKAQIPELEIISPMVNGRSVSVVNKDKSGTYSIKGVAGNYSRTLPVKLNAGRFINDMDVSECRKVCVLGQKIVDEVFGGRAPLGQWISVGSVSYQCVGVVERSSQSVNIGSGDESSVTLPYTVVQRIYNMGDNIHMMTLVARSDTPIEYIENQIRAVLSVRHQISPDDKSAITFLNLDRVLKVFRMLVLGINVLIWIVGMGTLMSGAIGVSNIVMITVKERTNEIGVRRALGAKPWSIISQIMSESLVITVLAGVMGLMAGIGTMVFVQQFSELGLGQSNLKLIDPMIDFNTAVAALVVIVVIGLAAGLLPASRAMKIKAIDAIREE